MKSLKTYLAVVALSTIATNIYGQEKLDKVSHAEPLYYDLVRDLGARKGEREINFGAELSNSSDYNKHSYLVEYEFAPINRLGFEVEADFSHFNQTNSEAEIPNHQLGSLRFSSQYSFFVSTKLKATMAVGYTQIVDFTDFKNYGNKNFYTGTVYNPFFVLAKRWGENVHSLVYISPLLQHNFLAHTLSLNWQFNTSFHYSIPQTKHFIGVELNHEVMDGKYELTIRPQLKIKLTSQLAFGIVTGIPINNPNERFSSFLRVIYEL